MKNTYTYDVHFYNDNHGDSKGFAESYQYCLDYIKRLNGSNDSYFGDYKNGTVSIVCNETGEHLYEEEIR